MEKYFRAFKISDIKDIDKKEITRRYRILAQKFHPDHGGTNNQFVFVKEAYDYVMERRKEFEKRESRKFYNKNFHYYGDGSIFDLKLKKWVKRNFDSNEIRAFDVNSLLKRNGYG